jgi:diguanylate cyclase (GGDEF)-like protein
MLLDNEITKQPVSSRRSSVSVQAENIDNPHPPNLKLLNPAADLCPVMTVDSPNPGADQILIPSPPRVPTEPSAADLHSLGEALKGSVGAVLELTVARTAGPDHAVDALVQESFERICRSSTIAVARWIAGEGMRAAIKDGRETWEIFGELAAHRAASLNEVVRRSLLWRNAMADVLHECAAHRGASPEALAQALNIVQMSLEFSLLRMCECFESERRRTDEELSRREEELGFMATHDALTGLPNRTLILERIEQMLARSANSRRQVAALFIDLDSFKAINDTLGHTIGDEVLRAVAARLSSVVRRGDVLGRLGGDEFVVISENLSTPAAPRLIAERLLDVLGEPFDLGGSEEPQAGLVDEGTRVGRATQVDTGTQVGVGIRASRGTRVSVTASIGMAMGERICAEELLRDADIAMYRAKWDGKNRYVVFEDAMHDTIHTRREIELHLHKTMQSTD